MNIKYKKMLVAEAKHSFAMVLSCVGTEDTAYNRMLLKWPDVVDALLEDNHELFRKDISYLICAPLRILAESLQELLSYNRDLDIETSMLMSEEDPIEAKNSLITLCNSMIYWMKTDGKKVEYISRLGEKSHD